MVDWWTEFGRALGAFLDQHGLLAAFVLLLIEEAGVPVPVPGDVLMLVLGVHARRGSVPLWQALAVMELATLIGSTVLYVGAQLAGRSLVYRYGRFIRLTPEHLDKVEVWLKHHGSRAVFLGRLVPGLRIVTAVGCGVFSVPFGVFFPAMGLGALVYILIYTLLGYFLGPPVLTLLEKVHFPFALLGSLVPLALILLWTFRTRQGLGKRAIAAPAVDHRQELRDGALAGGVATIASALLLNVVINLAGNLAFNAPGTLVERTAARLAFAFAREVQPVWLVVAVPAFLAVGVAWGALYPILGVPWLPRQWPDWLKGVVFAMLPLLASLLIAMPLLGLGFVGVGVTGPVAVSGELMRHVAFGALVGWLYPVFRARRPVKVMAHTPADIAPNPAAAVEC